ncbi:MAG: YbhB/YbcL family Raf kinase inhibitor-like protein [Woeseia sp.]
MTMAITSVAFEDGGAIPAIYTCEGYDISPPLNFTGVPDAAQTLVLIVDDPDAPDPKAPRMTWVHWVLYNLPAAVSALDEDAAAHGLPPGAIEGKNDWGRSDYGGPCPPVGRHRYFHKLYALDVELADLTDPTKAELEQAMEDHVLATASLIGTYQKNH